MRRLFEEEGDDGAAVQLVELAVEVGSGLAAGSTTASFRYSSFPTFAPALVNTDATRTVNVVNPASS